MLKALNDGCLFIYGHIPLSSCDAFLEHVEIVTFLRHPISRIISAYNFWKSRPLDPHMAPEERFVFQAAHSLSFDEMVRSDHKLIASTMKNEMVRQLFDLNGLAGTDKYAPLLELHAIQDKVTIGISEMYNQSVRVISEKLSVYIDPTIQENATLDKSITQDRLSNDTLDVIYSNNLLDVALYNMAVKSLIKHERRSFVNNLYRSPLSELATPLIIAPTGEYYWSAEMPLIGHNLSYREGLNGCCYCFAQSPESDIYFVDNLPDSDITVSIILLFYTKDSIVGSMNVCECINIMVNDLRVPDLNVIEVNGSIRLQFVIPHLLRKPPVLTISLIDDCGIKLTVFSSPDTRRIFAALQRIEMRA